MANQITDARTVVNTFDTVTGSVDLSGSAAGTQDLEIYIQGTASVGNYVTNTLSGIMYDAGATQDWSGNTFYIWLNSGIVGLLDTKANGGMRIRFAGATVTDFFEVYVGGSDSWPNAVSGGWTQFVVDIDVARATAITNGWTGGNPPVTTAIRYVGYAAQTGGTMPRMADNTWIDEIRRLPSGSPAVIVEGQNGGLTPWGWSDVRTQLGVASGVVKDGPGGSYVLNGPIQFGIDDLITAHRFSDTSQVLLWDNQEFIDDTLYALTARGNALTGTTQVTAGVRSGTGNDSTGARGWIIQAASDGARWTADFNDPNVDAVNLWGSTLIHAGALALDSTNVSVISTQMIDCEGAVVTGSEQIRNSVIAPAVATSSAFMIANDISTIVNCEFESSGTGHAIELQTPLVATQDSIGNLFAGYASDAGTAGDRALYNNQGGAVTINVSGGGEVMSVRNGTGASTNVVATVNFSLTGLVDGTEVRIYRVSDDVELYGEENSSGGTVTYQYNYTSDTPVYIHIHHVQYVPIRLELSLTADDASVPVQQRFDRAYSNP